VIFTLVPFGYLILFLSLFSYFRHNIHIFIFNATPKVYFVLFIFQILGKLCFMFVFKVAMKIVLVYIGCWISFLDIICKWFLFYSFFEYVYKYVLCSLFFLFICFLLKFLRKKIYFLTVFEILFSHTSFIHILNNKLPIYYSIPRFFI
jgi:hypothetical protein